MGTESKHQIELLCNENGKDGKDGKANEKLIKFNQKRFTPAVADKVLPLYEEIFELQKNNIGTKLTGDIEYADGTVAKCTMKDLMNLQLEGIKPANKEDYKKYNELCYEIVKNVIDYTVTSEKYRDQIDSDTGSAFWRNQSIQDVRDFVQFFRSENPLGI